MILYGHDKAGGFIAGCSKTGFTVYSYPTSERAEEAKRDGQTSRVARDAIMEEIAFRCIAMPRRDLADYFADYDRRNWDRLTTVLLG